MNRYAFNEFDHLECPSLDSVTAVLGGHGCHVGLVKELPKNANDKNQVYIHSDVTLLNTIFRLSFSERGHSASEAKRGSSPGRRIPQAVFHQFGWVDTEGRLSRVKACKAIVYTQYPEARLSGFLTEDGRMPRSLSVEYTRLKDAHRRFMVLGATHAGEAMAMMVVNPSATFIAQVKNLEPFHDSRVCKAITMGARNETGGAKLEALFRSEVKNRRFLGCRADKHLNRIPFNGTQVHGYTLEYALGIRPNSGKAGDIFGIELKCLTRKKVTLFTPEADGGLYARSYPEFMTTYGYLKGDDYRFTGLHRAYCENKKTGLTLKIVWTAETAVSSTGSGSNSSRTRRYDPEVPIRKQLNNLQVILEDNAGAVAASWSLERLLNCWGVKHQQVVYVRALKSENRDPDTRREGFKWVIEYEPEVLWCSETSSKHLFDAIHHGLVFLDPAPKYNPSEPKRNKRRTQWRVNNIEKAAQDLYERTQKKKL